MATTEAGKEALWIAQFLAALGYRLPGYPVYLKADNWETIILTANPEFYRRNKHIEVRHQWIWEKIDSKEIVIIYISTKDMVANGLTKALNPKTFTEFRAMIGMHWISGHKMTEWECWDYSHTMPEYRTISGPNAPQLCPFHISMHFNFVPYLIFSASHLCLIPELSHVLSSDCVSTLRPLRPCLNCWTIQAASYFSTPVLISKNALWWIIRRLMEWDI